MDKELLLTWIEAGTVQVPQLLLERYGPLGLNEKELALILHIVSFQSKGLDFPTPEQISERMTLSAGECTAVLRKLVQQELIGIEEGAAEGIRFEKYSLTPLWTKLIELLHREKRQADLQTVMTEESDLYTIFEKEFGRPLSPIECESLAMWIDQDGQDPTLIKAALREAVLSGKINFRYIDRILFEWKKNGVRTIEQARVHSMKFRKKTQPPVQQSATRTEAPFYNWLEQ